MRHRMWVSGCGRGRELFEGRLGCLIIKPEYGSSTFDPMIQLKISPAHCKEENCPNISENARRMAIDVFYVCKNIRGGKEQNK